jgi:UDP-N-acetylglucosamine--N-acetylmuramyl-(pentapeptide) pyrophosphoryl-undecaprenol N-acetylglucosamine transferase
VSVRFRPPAPSKYLDTVKNSGSAFSAVSCGESSRLSFDSLVCRRNRWPYVSGAGLAEELLSRGFRVAFATDSRGQKYLSGMESVPQFLLSSAPYLSGIKGKWGVIKALLKGYFEAHGLIKRLRPAVAVGFGGYPSAPPMFAALHRRIPTLIHEQNAILGMANILLAPFVGKIALSLSPTARLGPRWAKKSRVTGNPVRSEIVALSDAPLS